MKNHVNQLSKQLAKPIPGMAPSEKVKQLIQLVTEHEQVSKEHVYRCLALYMSDVKFIELIRKTPVK